MSMFSNKEVDVLQTFANAINGALDNALDNGYDQVDEDPSAVADNMCECDADLEMVPSHLLVPHIEHWQMIQRIKRNAQI